MDSCLLGDNITPDSRMVSLTCLYLCFTNTKTKRLTSLTTNKTLPFLPLCNLSLPTKM